MSEKEDKQQRQDTIAGLAALFVILVFSINEMAGYGGIALVIILVLNFLWSYLKRHERKDGSYKEAGKTLLAGTSIVLAIAAFSYLMSPSNW